MDTYEVQLVLQLPEDCPLPSLDYEDDIDDVLGDSHEVDGNSYGCGTIEFFINTNDPIAAFEL